MPFERTDYERTRAKADSKDTDRAVLQSLQRAAVNAEHVTSDEAWDVYLSYIQKSILENMSQRDQLMRDLASPALVNSDQVAQRRIAVMLHNERINVLSWVIAMPTQIKKLGAAAVEKLKALPEVEAQSAA